MKIEEITIMIHEADEMYLGLLNILGYDHPDVQYMKGIRDGYLRIYNLLKEVRV